MNYPKKEAELESWKVDSQFLREKCMYVSKGAKYKNVSKH